MGTHQRTIYNWLNWTASEKANWPRLTTETHFNWTWQQLVFWKHCTMYWKRSLSPSLPPPTPPPVCVAKPFVDVYITFTRIDQIPWIWLACQHEVKSTLPYAPYIEIYSGFSHFYFDLASVLTMFVLLKKCVHMVQLRHMNIWILYLTHYIVCRWINILETRDWMDPI